MPHEIHLISTIAAAFGFAMLLGLLAARLKLPPLFGLFAGWHHDWPIHTGICR